MGAEAEPMARCRGTSTGGFYHGLQVPHKVGAVWQLLRERLSPHDCTLRTLVLLDGCRFPFARFSLAGFRSCGLPMRS